MILIIIVHVWYQCEHAAHKNQVPGHHYLSNVHLYSVDLTKLHAKNMWVEIHTYTVKYDITVNSMMTIHNEI